ncbi:hypothetical protein ABIA30_001292 [Mycobacterium sp. MAA66]
MSRIPPNYAFGREKGPGLQALAAAVYQRRMRANERTSANVFGAGESLGDGLADTAVARRGSEWPASRAGFGAILRSVKHPGINASAAWAAAGFPIAGCRATTQAYFRCRTVNPVSAEGYRAGLSDRSCKHGFFNMRRRSGMYQRRVAPGCPPRRGRQLNEDGTRARWSSYVAVQAHWYRTIGRSRGRVQRRVGRR